MRRSSVSSMETDLKPAADLTCVGAPRARSTRSSPIIGRRAYAHIVALRGDMPNAGESYAAHGEATNRPPNWWPRSSASRRSRSASRPIREASGTVAGMGHRYLKSKIDAGATRAMNAVRVRLTMCSPARSREGWHRQRLVPGLMPTTNFKGVARMASCGASIPDWLSALYEGLDDPGEPKLVAAGGAGGTGARLRAEGFDQSRPLHAQPGGAELWPLHDAGIKPHSQQAIGVMSEKRRRPEWLSRTARERVRARRGLGRDDP